MSVYRTIGPLVFVRARIDDQQFLPNSLQKLRAKQSTLNFS